MEGLPAPDLGVVAAALRRGTTRLGHRLRAEGATQELSTNKIAVLGHLYRRGPASPGAIATAERQQPQSLTRVFAELEAGDLVVRSVRADDRRSVLLSITEAGRAALRAEMVVRDAWLAAALAALTPAEVRLLHVASDLMEALAEEK